jgi:hypothetical protein
MPDHRLWVGNQAVNTHGNWFCAEVMALSMPSDRLVAGLIWGADRWI